MRPLRRWLHRAFSLARRGEREERLRTEIEDHIARQTAENVRAGLDAAEARRQAILKFGPVESVREEYRDRGGLPLIETLARDVRYAARRLRKSPVFTTTAVLTLALGIGATTAIFTLAWAVLLKSLAVARPEELLRLGKEARCCFWGGYSQDKEYSLVSYELYQRFRDNTKGFSQLAAFSASQPLFGARRVGAQEPAGSYPGEFVSGNYFATFGVRAYAGRVLAPEDDRPGAPPAAMMSYRLWRDRYGADPSVVGATFNLNQKPFTLVGITPPGFFGETLRSNAPDFFLPLNTEPLAEADTDLYTPNNNWLELIGRMRRGAAPPSIEAEMRIELKQWLLSHWGDMGSIDRAKFPRQTLYLEPGGAGISAMREEYEQWLEILLGASGFTLLVVAANLAGLMLVRGLEQRRQVSLSMALGARASRMVRQAMAESLLLSALGGAAGLLVAYAGASLIMRFVFPAPDGRSAVPIDAAPSLPVLGFALGISLITGFCFGIAPAWMATRVDPIEALRGSGRSTALAGSRSRKALVVLQAALSVVLLSASGLLLAALHNLENEDFGFEPQGRIVAHIDPKLAGYSGDRLTLFYRSVQDSLAKMPEVDKVALCTYSPLGGNFWGAGIWIDGRPGSGTGGGVSAAWDRATPGYLSAIGNPILRGRGIAERDTQGSRHVAVVNEAFARKYFPNEDPIGKYFGQHGVESAREYEIVGITKNARYFHQELGEQSFPFFLLPEAQHDFVPGKASMDANPGSHILHDIVIAPRRGATLSIGRIRQAIAAADPDLPVISIRTLRAQVGDQFLQQRLIARLTSFFGLLALVLSCISVYGAMAWNVGARTAEIGVRMALGADGRSVLALVLRGVFTLVGAGLAIGLALTFLSGRFLKTQLYGLNPNDPVALLMAVGTLGLFAIAASLIPAVRATRISPQQALRAE